MRRPAHSIGDLRAVAIRIVDLDFTTIPKSRRDGVAFRCARERSAKKPLVVRLHHLHALRARNDYGHPRPETLTALGAVPGLRLFRTDADGRVVVESDGTTLRVRSDR